jgi:nuclear GTP-binding protein
VQASQAEQAERRAKKAEVRRLARLAKAGKLPTDEETMDGAAAAATTASAAANVPALTLQKQLSGQDLSRLAVEAAAAATTFAATAVEEDAAETRRRIVDRSAFSKEFTTVVERSDVIIEVLDARDPLGCHSQSVLSRILAASPSKRVVIVLNKVDLIPPAAARDWLRYLTRATGYPVVAFRAATGTRRGQRIGRVSGTAEDTLSRSAGTLQSNVSLGADVLMSLLKEMSRVGNASTSHLVACVVGYPNTGKSSIINSLAREKITGVAAKAGFTRAVQEVKIDLKLRILDSPGIYPEKSRDTEDDLILRNAVAIDRVDDVFSSVTEIFRRTCAYDAVETPEGELVRGDPCPGPQQALAQALGVDKGFMGPYSPDSLILAVARKYECIKRGGLADLDQAGRIILRAWTEGRVNYFVPPPSADDLTALGDAVDAAVTTEAKGDAAAAATTTESAAIVPQLAPAFSLESLLAQQEAALTDAADSRSWVLLQPTF